MTNESFERRRERLAFKAWAFLCEFDILHPNAPLNDAIKEAYARVPMFEGELSAFEPPNASQEALQAEVERLRGALNSALKMLQNALGPAFKVEALPQDQHTGEPGAGSSKPRFTVESDGRFIYDDDFGYDAKLKLDGDWPADSHRQAYAQAVCDALNKASVPTPEKS